MESRALHSVNGLAHNLIHKICAKGALQWKALSQIAWHDLKIKCLRYKRPVCPLFAQEKNVLMNQATYRVSMCLHTILSTKDVQNIGRRAKPPRRIRFDHKSLPASFLRNRNFPIRINALDQCQWPCSQSYPQKVCRTVLAVELATRYIAGFDVTSFLT